MRYGVIENGVCINIVKAAQAFAAVMGWVELTGDYGIGDLYTDGVWSHPIPKPEPESDGE